MHSLRTIWNIHEPSAAAARRVPILRKRTISASCVASSASSGVEQSVWAKRRTCAWEPETSVAIARGSPSWAALTTCSVGQEEAQGSSVFLGSIACHGVDKSLPSRKGFSIAWEEIAVRSP